MFYIILIVVLAVIGNFLIRRFLAKEKLKDKTATVSEAGLPELAETSSLPLSVQAKDIVKKWGKPSQSKIQIGVSLHPRVKELLDEFEYIGPDNYFQPINRSFIDKPFSENKNFIQIGAWGDGSEVLAKCDALDSCIYLAEIEDGDPKHPSIIARTMDEFLVKAWNLNQDSLQLRK